MAILYLVKRRNQWQFHPRYSSGTPSPSSPLPEHNENESTNHTPSQQRPVCVSSLNDLGLVVSFHLWNNNNWLELVLAHSLHCEVVLFVTMDAAVFFFFYQSIQYIVDPYIHKQKTFTPMENWIKQKNRMSYFSGNKTIISNQINVNRNRERIKARNPNNAYIQHRSAPSTPRNTLRSRRTAGLFIVSILKRHSEPATPPRPNSFSCSQL